MNVEAGEVVEYGRSHLIKRPRLTCLLDASEARIILLVAPAGYGKTTLAREWLTDRPHGWYRGNSATADVAALALGLARAASVIVPAAAERLTTRLRVSTGPTEEVEPLAELLAEDLAAWPEDAWLVFDDYHFACDSEASERFVAHLAASCPLRLLIASRSRPNWATARQLLYGEICEIGRNLLAMNQEEAQSALSNLRPAERDGLIALADGWPALLALATLAEELEQVQQRPSQQLYSYFAEELYQGLSAADQRALRILALPPIVVPEVARFLVGEEVDRVIERGLSSGFFLSTSSCHLEFHPLLRSFLGSKFVSQVDDPDGAILSGLIDILLNRQEWDDAFELIERFFTVSSFVRLLEVSLPRMVDEARLPTLDRWIRVAGAHRVDSPVLDLAEAELALADGEWRRAEALATQATRRLRADSPLRSKAFCIAGTSAHMAYRN